MQATLNKSILIGLAAIALSLGFAFSAYADDGSWNNDWNKWDHNNRDKQECNQGNWEWSGWDWRWKDSWDNCDSNKHSFSNFVSVKIGGHDSDRKDSDWQNRHDDNDGHDWKGWEHNKSDKDWKDNDWKDGKGDWRDGKDGRDGKDDKDGWDGGDNRW